jgi:hypothetical protein
VGRYVIEKTVRTAAAPAVVYRLLRDGSTWPEWSALTAFELEREGDGEPEGVGAVRMFRNGRLAGWDEVTGFEQDRRFRYRHLRGLPVRNYEGDVNLTPDGDGTTIKWRVTFDPKFPGTGWLVHRALTRFVGSVVDGLGRYASGRQA